MQDKPSGAGDEQRAKTTVEEDAHEERRVLREVLSIYPESFTLDELVRELTAASPPQFSDEDAVRRAIRELTAVGLIHRVGDLVLPTRSATVFYTLIQEGEI